MKFFSYDSPFSQLLLKLCYSCYLNLLWFLCSVPIFTIGASTTALYYVSLKVVKGEEGSIAETFFRAFRENFRQATVIWLILLAIGLFLAGDGYIVYHLRLTSADSAAVFWTLILAVLIAAAIAYVIELLYVFPLIASVTNTNAAMLKNALLIGTHYLFATILVAAVHFAMFFVVVAWFTPLLILGEGLCAMVSAWLLSRVLAAVSYDPHQQPASADEETSSQETGRD